LYQLIVFDTATVLSDTATVSSDTAIVSSDHEQAELHTLVFFIQRYNYIFTIS